MKNVTISMDDKLYRETRIGAAKAGLSVSKYLAGDAKARNEADQATATENGRNRQLEAIEKILAGPKWDVTVSGRMPTREERNARR